MKAKMDPNLLRGIDILGPLSDLAIEQILEAPENDIEEFDAKTYILKEAEDADCMYIILDGSVEILVKGGASGRQVVGSDREIPIETLHKGDFFGEQALLPGGPGKRNASARTIASSTLFRMHKKYVDLNVKRDLDMTFTQITMLDLPQDKEVREILETMRLFQGLNEDEVKNFREWTEVVEIGPDEMIIREREKAQNMYVVLEGELEVFTAKTDSSEEAILGTLGKGRYFGESALLPDQTGKRNACVRGKTRCRLLKIPRKYFRIALKRDTALANAIAVIGKSQRAKIKKAKGT